MNIIDLYIIFIEIIQEFHNYFNDFNKYTLCDGKLYDLAFAIKNNKIFNQFYTRFLIIMTLFFFFFFYFFISICSLKL